VYDRRGYGYNTTGNANENVFLACVRSAGYGYNTAGNLNYTRFMIAPPSVNLNSFLVCIVVGNG